MDEKEPRSQHPMSVTKTPDGSIKFAGNNNLGDMEINHKQFYARGHTAYFITKEGTVLSTGNPNSDPQTWHEIATYNGKGYRRVRLQGRTFKVHRVVAEAFVPNPYGLPYVLHKDGDRENNHYGNLEWSSRQSNHPLTAGHGAA